MGRYTDHWQGYARESRRRLVQFALLFGLGLPATGLIAWLSYRLSGEYQVVPHLTGLAVWLVAFTWLALRGSAVTCPRCAQKYQRGRWLSNCPKCNLRMLQEDD